MIMNNIDVIMVVQLSWVAWKKHPLTNSILLLINILFNYLLYYIIGVYKITLVFVYRNLFSYISLFFWDFLICHCDYLFNIKHSFT